MSKRRLIFMTGATAGLGKVSAMKSANDGDTLLVLARDNVKAEALKSDFKSLYPKALGKIEIIIGDLSSFDAVYASCQEIKEKYPVIDILVNNAGIMNFKFKQTEDGIEETFQVNLLSPLLICHLLYDNLAKARDPKIIFTSSGLHQGEINFSDLEFKNSFSSFKAYRQSKLGIILICRLLAGSLKNHNVRIYCQHPGLVRTELGRNAGWFSRTIFYLMGKSPEKGAKTLSYLIEKPSTELRSGEYYVNKTVTTTTRESYDMTVAEKLRHKSAEYLEKYIKEDSPILIMHQPKKL